VARLIAGAARGYSARVNLSEAATAPGAIDSRLLRDALGRFATGVTLATCRGLDGRAVGLTVNSFNALSLEPALVLWSLRLQSPSLPDFDAAPMFAINVLAEGQVELSRRFAASTMAARFDEGLWHAGLGGAPLLGGCAAHFECETVSRQDAGDHRLYIGRVLRLQSQPVPPLVFHAGHYHLLGEVL
jgi:flavin reductase (DIM6/NTAB) family NADH-FMN oxidoreductase RutF